MPRKYKLNTNTNSTSDIDPSVTKAVKNATPLTAAFAELVMSKIAKNDEVELDDEAKKIQDIFNKRPSSVPADWLASLLEAVTGYKPTTVTNTSYKTGDTFLATDGKVYAVITNTGSTAYGVGATGTTYATATGNSKGIPGTVPTTAQVGLFAKDFLKVDGKTFVKYVNGTLGTSALSILLDSVDGVL